MLKVKWYDVSCRWQLTGGHIGSTCGVIHSGTSAIFDGPGKSRKLCTPIFDPRSAGNIRFHFSLGKFENLWHDEVVLA